MVTLAWIPILVPSFGNYSVIRSVRALRPLRALKRVPGMPVLISSILAAMPKLGNVLALCCFLFLAFGIVGMELFKVRASRRVLLKHTRPCECAASPNKQASVSRSMRSLTLSWSLHVVQGVLHYRCALGGFRGEPGRRSALAADSTSQALFDTGVACNPGRPQHPQCEAGSHCRYFDAAPLDGLMSFDDIGAACIVILQTITFDTWTEAMYALSISFSPYAIVFFVLIVILGGFFVVNLFLAVIFQEFLAAQMRDAAVEEMNQRNAEIVKSVAAEDPPVVRAAVSVSDIEGGVPGTDSSADTAALLAPSRRSSSGGRGSHSGTGGGDLCDCTPRVGSWRAMLGRAVNTSWFGNLSTLVVFVNMGLMCLPYYGMSTAYSKQLEDTASNITWIFIAEMVIKLIALGCSAYWADGWNVLDGIIVFISVIEMVATAICAGGSVKLSFLRMLRVLRMLRLMRSWEGLYKIVTTFGKAMPQMANIFVLMFLILVIFSLLGMQLFGGAYNPSTGFSDAPCPGGVCPNMELEEKPRYHFDYFGPSMITCFILMTGSWIDPLGPAVEVGGTSVTLYFVLIVLIGCYIIMNLFIAILLNAFADNSNGVLAPRASTDTPAATAGAPATPKSSKRRPWPDDFSLCWCGSPCLQPPLCMLHRSGHKAHSSLPLISAPHLCPSSLPLISAPHLCSLYHALLSVHKLDLRVPPP